MKNIQSIERSFRIIETIHQHNDGVGVSAIAEQVELHVSTTSRILSTLENLGMIARVNDSSKFVVGEGLLAFATKMPWTERLIVCASPHLEELAYASKEAVGLTQIIGDQCHIFYQIDSPHLIQIRDWTGEHYPLHITSTGKLFLAQLDEADLSEYLAQPLAQFASATITDPDTLHQDIDQVRQQGYAWTLDELEEGLISIAAPIVGATGDFVAGVYISAPAFRFTKAAEKERLRTLVVEAAQRISAQFSP